MSIKTLNNLERRQRRIRAVVNGTAERPRLAVVRSLRFISVQAIDDAKGVTLASADDKKLTGEKMERAKQVGATLGAALKKLGIASAAFDRRGRRYHGRIKALADAVREAGIAF